MIAGTADSSLENIAFYKKAGFYQSECQKEFLFAVRSTDLREWLASYRYDYVVKKIKKQKRLTRFCF